MQLAYDVSGVDHKKTIEGQTQQSLPPKGMYTCVLKEVANVDKKSGEGKQLKITYLVTQGVHKNFPFYDYFDPKEESQKWKMDQFLYALGIDTGSAGPRGKLDTTKHVGKTTVRVRCKHDTYVDSDNNTIPSAKCGGVFPFDPTKDGEAFPQGDGAAAAEAVDWYSLGEEGDAGDVDAQAELATKAAEFDIDPNAVETWVEVAENIQSAISDAAAAAAAEEEAAEAAAPAKKATAKKAAASAKAAPAKAGTAKKAAGATKKAAAAPEPEPEPEEEETDWEETGLLAETDDDDAQTLLKEKAAEFDLDPDEFTWEELAAAVSEKVASGGAAGEKQDYDSMTDEQLKTELESRGQKVSGTRKVWILRLQKSDGDPLDVFQS